MQINIGEKIKNLRKRNGRKQEDLATALGVTPQAVSRWEANGGYPDLGMIPAIANYFHITIDELFGYDNDRNRIIQEYNDKAQAMLNNNQDMTACITLLRKGLEEFPDTVDFKIKLAAALNKQGWNHQEDKPNAYWEEAAFLYEGLLEQNSSCVVPLISIYSMLGKHELAEKKASEQPSIDVCREVLLGNLGSIGSISDDKKAEQYRVEAVLQLIHALRKSLDEAIICNSELKNSREGIELLSLLRQLYEKIVGKDCDWAHSELCLIDLTCTAIAGNIQDFDAAFRYFDSAFQHYTQFEQWRTEKCNKSFDTTLLRSVIPLSMKVILCEPQFFKTAIHSFPDEKKKIILENPNYSCIFNS